MKEIPVNTYSAKTCDNCALHSGINCHFTIGQLIRFYLIVLPSFILGGTGIYQYSSIFLVMWLAILGLFFFVIEIHVLCTHCPHYAEPDYTLRCWANYGAPKPWKFRPGPMNGYEKAIQLSGFAVVWGYPVPFMISNTNWYLLIGYVCSVLFFFISLKRLYCKICMNLSCPLNGVKPEIKRKILEKNPVIRDSWK